MTDEAAPGPAMHECLPRVWVGSLVAARDRRALAAAGITAIVAVGADPAFPGDGGIEYHCVDALDLPWVDILAAAPPAAAFIARALSREGGRVLIHCVYGQSRSAALAVAYGVLRCGMSSRGALSAVVAARPCVSVNAGFAHQLALLGEMAAGAAEGRHTRARAQYRLLAAAAARRCRGMVAGGFEAPHTTFLATDEECSIGGGGGSAATSDSGSGGRHGASAVDDGGGAGGGGGTAAAAAAAAAAPPSAPPPPAVLAAHCGKCGVRLFTTYSVVRGAGGDGGASPSAWPLHGLALGGAARCTSIFTEPPDWADVPPAEAAEADAGRLACRRCGAKLGGWNWAGVACSCGVHVAPAFHVAASKVTLRQLT